MRNWQETPRVTVRVGKETREKWEAAAKAEGYWNLQEWIVLACSARAGLVMDRPTSTATAIPKKGGRR